MPKINVVIESEGGNSFRQGSKKIDKNVKNKIQNLDFEASFHPTFDASPPGTDGYLMNCSLSIFAPEAEAKSFVEDLLEQLRDALKAGVSCRQDFELYFPYR